MGERERERERERQSNRIMGSEVCITLKKLLSFLAAWPDKLRRNIEVGTFKRACPSRFDSTDALSCQEYL